MRTRAAAAALVLIAVLTVTGPAGAKGMTGGTVDGEGIDGAAFPAQHVDDTGVYELIWDAQTGRRLAEAPTEALGPRWVITWQLMGPNGDVPIEQSVYPYAEGGPVTHVEPGQPMWPSARTLGGWFRAPATLVTSLQALGVAPPATSSGGTAWTPIGGSVLAVVLLGAAIAVLGRRSRGEVAPAAG